MSFYSKKRERISRQIAELDAHRRRSQPEVDEDTLNDSEKAFAVMADLRGKKIYRSGWPDFMMADPETGSVLGVEVKTDQDTFRPSQIKMFSLLEKIGVRVVVWNPSRPGVMVPWRMYGRPKRESRPEGPRLWAPRRPSTVK